VTVILYTKDHQNIFTQFREISSYQHTSDKYGYKEDRIIFGLGSAGKPKKMILRWPNGNEDIYRQDFFIKNWNPLNPTKIIHVYESSTMPTLTPSLKPTHSTKTLPTLFPEQRKIAKQLSNKPSTKECVDSAGNFYINKNHGTQTCKYVAQYRHICSINTNAENCPFSCGQCNTPCSDSKDAIWVNKKFKMRFCLFFHTSKGKPFCAWGNINNFCPETCKSVCKDSNDKVFINKLIGKQMCSYIASNKKYCSVNRIKLFCPISCGKCKYPCAKPEENILI